MSIEEKTEFLTKPCPCNGLGKRGQNLSIMIPNYNNAHYIGETLRSLLAAGDKIADAQIEVLDNCSTDNSEAVVKEVGRGRVRWTQHRENIGTYRNHNMCYEKATRPWVHILHSDDTIFASAYEEFDRCLTETQAESDTSLDGVFARCVYGSDTGIWGGLSPLFGSGERGVLTYHPMTWAAPPMHFLSTIVRREAALALGGFDAECGPMTDWNFYWRLSRSQKVAYSNACVGFYRLSPTNHTSALTKTGEFSRSGLRQVLRIVQAVEEEQKTGRAEYSSVNVSDLFDPFFDHVVGECYHHVHDFPVFDAHFAVLREFPYSRRRQGKINRLWMVRMKKKINARKAD